MLDDIFVHAKVSMIEGLSLENTLNASADAWRLCWIAAYIVHSP